MVIQLNTGGERYTAAEIAEARANAQREMEAIERENEERLTQLDGRSYDLGQSARAEVRACIADARRNRQSPLDAMKTATKIIAAWENNGAELLAAARKRIADHERTVVARQGVGPDVIAQSTAFQKQRALAAARANPLPASGILLRVEQQKGFRVRLRNGAIEVAPADGLSAEDEAYLIVFAELVAAQMKQRETWRTVAAVTTD